MHACMKICMHVHTFAVHSSLYPKPSPFSFFLSLFLSLSLSFSLSQFPSFFRTLALSLALDKIRRARKMGMQCSNKQQHCHRCCSSKQLTTRDVSWLALDEIEYPCCQRAASASRPPPTCPCMYACMHVCIHVCMLRPNKSTHSVLAL